MDESEVLILIVAFVAMVGAWIGTMQAAMHRLYFRGNPGPGLVRAAVLASLFWIWLVCLIWADDSVRGVYVLFYLVLGYAAVKLFGHAGSRITGLRYRIDVLERRNPVAGLVMAAFVLATGLIFGGSLWGDADPVGDDEGGWWIVWGFFLMGWIALVMAFRIWLRRERKRFPGTSGSLRRTHDPEDGRAAALFLLAAAIPLTDAVAGDFWGWRHGLLTFGVLAGLLLAHEVFLGVARAGAGGSAEAPDGAGAGASGGAVAVGRPAGARATEGLVYLGLALAAWGANRVLNIFLGPGG
ncbi:MAG: hypothetical protein EA422_05905 [Gemmatimonadales bacterium]|nr:MAG: hypothetical protein EA422_05905 [Gemmatimonadales bacterium]